MSFPSPGDPPDPGIKPPSPALASGLFTTVPPGKPMQLQAEGLVKAKHSAGSAQDERSRGQSGQHLVGRLFLHCGLWAYCSKADCPEHPAPGKPGGDASSSWTAPSSLSSRLCCPPWALPAGHPEDSCTEVSCSPSGPGTGRAARRPSGREPAHFGDSPLPVCPQGQKPVRQLPTSVQALG